MIYTNFVVVLIFFDASCQVTKLQAFWFWRRKILTVFAINSQGGHSGKVTWSIYANFVPPPLPKNAPQTVLTLTGQAVSEKKIMEIVDDGRTTGHCHPISSPFEPKGSCELNLGIPLHTQVLLYKNVLQWGKHVADMLS